MKVMKKHNTWVTTLPFRATKGSEFVSNSNYVESIKVPLLNSVHIFFVCAGMVGMGDGAGRWGLQELRKDGFDLCENRFIELRPVLDEV